MLLAIDTSTRQSGIALYDPERSILAEHHWTVGRQHTVELMPEVAHLLEQAHVRPADLCGVAVALGPGSFTGVRVALAAGKGLALAQNLPLFGISTLDVIAYPHQAQSRPVVAVVPAGRGRVCWAMYAHDARGWTAQAAPALSTLADLAAALQVPVVMAGELTPADRASLAGDPGSPIHLLPPALAMRRAGNLAEMAWARFEAGQRDDAAALSPNYLQAPITHPKPTQAR
jgi:tRNA threonylcarbamoyladenosine biosynthesis protein TsaB